ncbi:MAG: NAD(P)H-hydrate dehydratase [Myxococcaceae bacterium]
MLTAAEVRESERIACDELGSSVALLMENAGRALADEALERASRSGRFLVLCGRGNNGGDGLVAARKLASAGRDVHVELVADPEKLDGEPARNLQALRAQGLVLAKIPATYAVATGDVVIDALLGTGLSRPPEGAFAEAIKRIEHWRKLGAKVVAADVPSGLHSDSGELLEPCVRADVTVAFGLKRGQVVEPGADACGELRVADIGLPSRAVEGLPGPGAFLLRESAVRALVPERNPSGHKGTYGHLLVVAGSPGKSGAAGLSGLAALRAGAGLVTLASRPKALAEALAHGPELMGQALGDEGPLALADLNAFLDAVDGKKALVIGPGIPRGEETGKLLAALLEELEVPCVLDADALNALELKMLERAKSAVILTPHPGEAGTLLKQSAQVVQKDRMAAAKSLAVGKGIAVLKGARTLIAFPDGSVRINPTGNPGMGTGGTGDVLAGILGGLLAQGMSAEDAATVGVFTHGLAGDLVAQRTGQRGLIASDLLQGLCDVWTRWKR